MPTCVYRTIFLLIFSFACVCAHYNQNNFAVAKLDAATGKNYDSKQVFGEGIKKELNKEVGKNRNQEHKEKNQDRNNHNIKDFIFEFFAHEKI